MKLSKIYNKDDRLLRGCGWTSNSYWMIKSELEPKNLQKKETTAELTENLIDVSLDRFGARDVDALVSCTMSAPSYQDGLYLISVKSQFEGKDTVYKFNADYIDFMREVGADSFKIIAKYQNTPIVAIKENEAIGFVMGIDL